MPAGGTRVLIELPYQSLRGSEAAEAIQLPPKVI